MATNKNPVSRNRARAVQFTAQEKQLIGKYLPANVESVFNITFRTPDDNRHDPSDILLPSLQSIAAKKVPPPKPSPVASATDQVSLRHNANLLGDAGYDLKRFLLQFQETTLRFGNKFRQLEDTKLIFREHLNFHFIADVLNSVRKSVLPN